MNWHARLNMVANPDSPASSGRLGRFAGKQPIAARLVVFLVGATLATIVAVTWDSDTATGQVEKPTNKSAPLRLSGLMGNNDEEREATFFMGRIRYSNNDGNDCSGVGENLVKLVAQVSTIQVQRERIVAFNDPRLFTTPFLFMNGHNEFRLQDGEVANLRNYFQRGGFLLASGCCTNPGFPQACRRELSRILPGERIRRLSYDHPIYRSFYKLSRIRCLHEPRDIYLEGLFDRGRLVAVLCEDGLCCAFSMDNRCNVGKGVSPDDGRKLALNIAVYSLTH